MNIRQETGIDKVFNAVSVIVLLMLGAVTLYPFYYLLIYSLNEPMDAMRGGLYFLPRKFSFISYRLVWAAHDIGPAAFISLARTVTGTALTIFCTSMLAYVLSRPNLIGRKFFNRLFVITIYISGGLIPWYLTLKSYGFTNTFLVYIIPGAIGVFNMILVRTYIQELPAALRESAEVDGANDFIIFIRIIFPLCVPVLAVVCIFSAVGQWNSWFDAAVFNASNALLQPLQTILIGMLKSAVIKNSQDIPLSNSAAVNLTPESMRAAITIIATLPIVAVYPFFQKHFTQGIMLGSVKG
jgi:putative aldouronate transport system permease protein